MMSLLPRLRRLVKLRRSSSDNDDGNDAAAAAADDDDDDRLDAFSIATSAP